MRGIRHGVGDCISCADFNGAVFVIQNHARATAVYRARGSCAIVVIVDLQRVEVGLNFSIARLRIQRFSNDPTIRNGFARSISPGGRVNLSAPGRPNSGLRRRRPRAIGAATE